MVRSGSKARLRFNHRSGNDGNRKLSLVILEERIPGGVGVFLNVDQPTALPQTDEAQREGSAFPAQPFVIESAPRARSLDWETVTVGEALAFLRPRPMLIYRARGSVLSKWQEEQKKRYMRFTPPWAGPDPKELEPEKVYRVLTDQGAAGRLAGKAKPGVAVGRPVPDSKLEVTFDAEDFVSTARFDAIKTEFVSKQIR